MREALEGAAPPPEADDLTIALAALNALADRLEADSQPGHLEHWQDGTRTRHRWVSGRQSKYLKAKELGAYSRRIANNRRAKAIRAAIAILTDCNEGIN